MIAAFMLTLGGVTLYIVVICIYAISCALIGQQLFAFYMRMDVEDPDFPAAPGAPWVPPVLNWDNFTNSLTQVFMFILDEEWHPQLYHAMTTNGYGYIAYWLIVLLLGEVLIVRLFIALYINQYIELLKDKKVIKEAEEGDEEEEEDEDEEDEELENAKLEGE
jgi:hypothetical protein